MRWILISASLLSSLPALANEDDSPRDTVVRFLENCRRARFEVAAEDLDLPEGVQDRAPILARHFYLVLDRYLDEDLGKISRRPEGKLKDGLPPQSEEIGKVPGPAGTTEPIRLFKRTQDGASPRWMFSRGTTERIDAWYARLGYSGLLDRLPGSLLGTGPMNLPWWQWSALSLMFLVSLVIGYLLSWPSRGLLQILARRTRATADDDVAARMRAPLALGWALLAAFVIRGFVGLAQRAELAVGRVLRIGFFVLFFWILLRGVGLIPQVLAGSAWASKRAGVRALLPVAARIAKVLVLGIAVIAVLSELQYPVGSLVAGLGIGGLALALAAQKTVENLFGAFSIGVDQPFREGDLVRIEDQVGVVESIGLRSTRVRTGERSAISWPNGKLAEMRLESLSARDRLRMFARLRLALGTRSETLRKIVDDLSAALGAEEKLLADQSSVQLVELGEFSIDVEVVGWLSSSDGAELGRIRQELLFKMMEIVERSGAAIAAKSAALNPTGPSK